MGANVMSATASQSGSATRSVSRPYVDTGGTTGAALSAGPMGPTREELWRDAIDCMLRWSSDPDIFAPTDLPDPAVLESAMDLAFDLWDQEEERPRATRWAAPTSIVPSGDGRIAFEWNNKDETVIVEIVGAGSATATVFQAGKVVEHGPLQRNPLTRKIEMALKA
jgi:hypothetical protein